VSAPQSTNQPDSFLVFREDRLVDYDTGAPASGPARFVHEQLRGFILEHHPCAGARSAFNSNGYGLGLYPEMASDAATSMLADGLARFIAAQQTLPGSFTTFVACFERPTPATELAFETLVWSQLQKLHDHDRVAWDREVAADPASAEFSYSFGGRAFFIVGLHPASSRWSRRFVLPSLVFNAHFQFESLRSSGKFERFQTVIRKRDVALQGNINPNLADFCEDSEAKQYSGRPVPPDWACPLKVRKRK
jgi:uncharacterized protein